MTINIEKKQLVTSAVVVIVVLVGVFGFLAVKNATYEKNAKSCQENIHKLYYMSALLSSEIHDTWNNYIFDDKEYIDRNTGKFYETSYDMPNDADKKWCSNFSEAIAEKLVYYKQKGIENTLDSLHSTTKSLLSPMTPAPKKFYTLHKDLNELFHTAEAMYNCAVSPEGNLQSYTNTRHTLSSEYKKQSSNLDIQIGEVDPLKKNKFELKALTQFL